MAERSTPSLARSGRAVVSTLRSGVLQALPRGAKDGVKEGLAGARRLTPAPAARLAERAARRPVAAPDELAQARRDRPGAPQTDVRLWVAPANFAGQGHEWARAAQRLPGVGARSMNIAGPIRFPTDYEVSAAVYRDLGWQREQRRALLDYTHVLVEAERPVLGSLYGSCAAETPALRRAGLTVAHVVHGSDARRPDLHAATHPHSPFRDPRDPRTARLQRLTRRNVAWLDRCETPVFVSTPDMIDVVPGARWCPVVVDADAWASDTPVLERERPVVVHAPSNGWLKGSDLVDPQMQALHDAGLIEYRTLRGLDRAAMRRVYREADIVLDQFVLGLYGVAAAEAMAAGRVVVAYVGDTARARVWEATGQDVPIVEATPVDVVDVIRGILADRDAARAIAAEGPSFVRRIHSGERSAAVLAEFLGVGTRSFAPGLDPELDLDPDLVAGLDADLVPDLVPDGLLDGVDEDPPGGPTTTAGSDGDGGPGGDPDDGTSFPPARG
ncbi:hypothetical protein [Mobilicoccus pelagius]|uniref:Glycosyltransferase n=1 Tax=Mobilicoccus pelagius NBRC 104925 TaxID=1089455 RepID=H5UMX4_9MICO|nr:hypothetical protein [Mobilicoccus pelagius]GAB47082.1 hypothetical protein MOPEL_003_01070 [Mobilicoccus pelagius NBRC 104925]